MSSLCPFSPFPAIPFPAAVGREGCIPTPWLTFHPATSEPFLKPNLESCMFEHHSLLHSLYEKVCIKHFPRSKAVEMQLYSGFHARLSTDNGAGLTF